MEAVGSLAVGLVGGEAVCLGMGMGLMMEGVGVGSWIGDAGGGEVFWVGATVGLGTGSVKLDDGRSTRAFEGIDGILI